LPQEATKQRWTRSPPVWVATKDAMNKKIENGSGARPGASYDETYKRHAVELTLHGDRTVKTVAKELGLPAWQLYDWRKLYAPRPGGGGPAPQTLEEAVKENGQLRARADPDARTGGGAKKITGHPLRNARERYAQIKAMKGEHPIRMLCELLKVSPSGYYRWCQQRPSPRQREDAAIAAKVAAAHRASRGTYGAPRILVDLQESGTRTSKRRCARLMREQGLQGRKKHRRKPRTTDSRHAKPVAGQPSSRCVRIRPAPINAG
jgi:transposase-like protein